MEAQKKVKKNYFFELRKCFSTVLMSLEKLLKMTLIFPKISSTLSLLVKISSNLLIEATHSPSTCRGE